MISVFRHPEDRVPVALFLAVFAADLSVFALATVWWVPIVWMVLMTIPKGWICSWNHHHQHAPMFSKRWANRAIEVVFGFQTGITSHAWFLHHVVGHHVNYLDQSKDESRWVRRDGSVMGEYEYALVIAATAYPRAWKVGAKYPRARRTLLRMGILQLMLLAGLAAWNPWNALWVFAIPMVVSLVLTGWATYFHHATLETDDHSEASFNILHPLYNRMTGNLGYHTAHHSKHGLHWSKLPVLHTELAREIPATCYREPGIPFVWFGAEAKVTLSAVEIEQLAGADVA
jgi:fatty acid desaturase